MGNKEHVKTVVDRSNEINQLIRNIKIRLAELDRAVCDKIKATNGKLRHK